MANSQIFFIILLVLATSFTTTLTSIHHDHDHNQNHLAIVHITNSLPQNNTNPMKIRCNSKQKDFGVKTLGCGDLYKWIVGKRDLYFCEALWGRFLASWHAFQPKTDNGQRSVFWLVKQNGLFLSWDNSTWVKKSIWETE